MGIAEDFATLCSNLTVNNRSDISARYRQITRRLNLDFYDSSSETEHSYYVGSYGRGTAIRDFHDLDVLFRLPVGYYNRFSSYQGNGQSALLQLVRQSLAKTYSRTEMGGDGQVVVVRFADDMRFEIVPAFLHQDGTSYIHADSNGGGSWKVKNPFGEIEAIRATDVACNNNLKQLCRMARAWRRKWDVKMGGLLVDTLAHGFIKDWKFRDKSYLYYDFMTRDFFQHLGKQDASQEYWLAPGSGQRVYNKGPFVTKAKQAHDLAVRAIDHETAGRPATARNKWREIYGNFYP
jgi:hypothetical protein